MLNAVQMKYEGTSAISLGRYPGFREFVDDFIL